MRVLVKLPGQNPEVREIEDGLDAMQEIVGGSIEMVWMSEDLEFDIVLNEEGKIEGLPMNIHWEEDIIVGPLFVMRHDNHGKPVSLTDEDVSVATTWLLAHQVSPRKIFRME